MFTGIFAEKYQRKTRENNRASSITKLQNYKLQNSYIEFTIIVTNIFIYIIIYNINNVIIKVNLKQSNITFCNL